MAIFVYLPVNEQTDELKNPPPERSSIWPTCVRAAIHGLKPCFDFSLPDLGIHHRTIQCIDRIPSFVLLPSVREIIHSQEQTPGPGCVSIWVIGSSSEPDSKDAEYGWAPLWWLRLVSTMP
ncbi:hypothetical protein K469DRAFT_692668 [Zopfia rhizophila CBS 207.26]|uniref:Uncharacterized protein n=1 Tax=Zopfia rhizophila CBS 207.26 TaxID=1314779 RepID=A0A6A6DPE3_9PEZI|nr:hypothetical protein K469DRAFT_692668 [Zopfia rhizophila CBS 207.26]